MIYYKPQYRELRGQFATPSTHCDSCNPCDSCQNAIDPLRLLQFFFSWFPDIFYPTALYPRPSGSHQHEAVLFSPEVDTEFRHMAESMHIICHQCLAHQWAQEIAQNYCTAPVCPFSIELNTNITTPTPAHASNYCVNCTKHHGRVFTPVNFNTRASSQYYAPHLSGYMIPLPSTYSMSMPLHPNSPTLGTNPKIYIHSPTPPASPTESSPLHSYPLDFAANLAIQL